MLWIPSMPRVIVVGLFMVAAALGLSFMSADAAPPQQDPYPPVCPCVVTVSVGEAAASTGDCIPVTCKAADTEGAPVVDLECTMSVISQPGTGATVTPASAMTDENGEATAELCVGSAPGPVVVLAETECCGSQGQVEVTVPAPTAVEEEVATPAPPAAPPATGGGISGGGSSPAPLIAVLSGIALAVGSLLVWRTGSRRRRSS
jgi:hypothetical protein